MLAITRRPGESFTIGDDITVTVVFVDRGHVRLSIEAPRELRILRLPRPEVTADLSFADVPVLHVEE